MLFVVLLVADFLRSVFVFNESSKSEIDDLDGLSYLQLSVGKKLILKGQKFLDQKI